MKKVINNETLKNKMKEAINLLCGTVKTTLGPKGNNVIINHSTFTPFITNDGVTIAENIESEDKIINTILTLAKEASIKTNEEVGDGTTTTLVLLESIFNEGLKLINNNINPIILKKELNDSLNEVIKELKILSKKPTKKDLLNITTTSSNSKYIGKIITDTYLKVKNIESITIKEQNIKDTKIIFNKGYSFECNLATFYYFKNKNEIKLNNPYIILTNSYIDNLENISNIINEIINNNKNLIIFAHDFSDDVVNQIISLYMDNIANIYLFKTPEYGINELIFLDDISIISNSEKINNIKLGKINSIIFNKEIATISFNKTNKINELIKNIKKDLNNSLDKDFNQKRLNMLISALAEIQVGGNTTLERRELVMRYTDALHAINSAKDGIMLGSGIPYLKISNKLKIKTNLDKIIKKALTKPFEQILINSGLNKDIIIKEIKNNDYNILYNTKTNNYEKLENTNIIDSLNVLSTSLTNAVSIASMLLTTTSLVINEYENNLNKINEIHSFFLLSRIPISSLTR